MSCAPNASTKAHSGGATAQGSEGTLTFYCLAEPWRLAPHAPPASALTPTRAHPHLTRRPRKARAGPPSSRAARPVVLYRAERSFFRPTEPHAPPPPLSPRAKGAPRSPSPEACSPFQLLHRASVGAAPAAADPWCTPARPCIPPRPAVPNAPRSYEYRRPLYVDATTACTDAFSSYRPTSYSYNAVPSLASPIVSKAPRGVPHGPVGLPMAPWP